MNEVKSRTKLTAAIRATVLDQLRFRNLLGQKNIRNTLVYTHLVNFESDDYVCRVARAVEEAKVLVESGFDYVTDVEGYKLFRKRK